ncbi:hypothetical protein Q9299_20760 [Gemmobacter fulvus]|uniref:hypothetical protein n=1 Tax=Gemmobacter fulvus TaxID=2840474 RepID=UPI002796879B|nr:hypothetical protein [Gemmobacter fulvus]MDQ1850740.1 hypothetical protein [Gemmobacter fulvus]
MSEHSAGLLANRTSVTGSLACGLIRPRLRLPVTGVLGPLAAVFPREAAAHASEGGFVMLLPTDIYIGSGALVVALTFVFSALVPRIAADRLSRQITLFRLPRINPLVTSIISLALLSLIILAGFIASPRPTLNPLPNTIWTVWWVGFVFATLLLGNIWAYLNPWEGLHWLMGGVPGVDRWVRNPPLPYPAALGQWPAVVLLACFGWFELIYPAPYDPERLAITVLVYIGITAGGMLFFGKSAWLAHGETFSVYFRMLSWLAPLSGFRAKISAPPTNPRDEVRVGLPGAQLLGLGAIPISGTVFILLALSIVSFDGLSDTIWWLALIGVNPLEFPGRSAVVLANTLGLAASFFVIGGAYVLAVILGLKLAGDEGSLRRSLGRFVVAILPIALGYHVAHYLPAFLIDIQWAMVALSDPFAMGWDLLGFRDHFVTGWMLNNFYAVRVIWNVQAGVVVLAHVVGVIATHLIELQVSHSPRTAIVRQLPMTVLMVAYTAFGLWLLSTPTGV